MDARTARANLAKMRSADVVLASFPRSGSLWLRTLLYNAWEVAQQRTLPLCGHLSTEFSPTLELDGFPMTDLPQGVLRLIKTHQPREVIAKSRWNGKILVLFRRPQDSFASAWTKFERATRLTEQSDEAALLAERLGYGLEAFIRNRAIPAWRHHSAGFLTAHANRQANLAFMSYEVLHNRTVAALAVILEWLEIDLPSDCLEQIVSNCEFSSVLEARRRISPMASLPLWKGKPGNGVRVLGTDLWALVEDELGPLYRQLRNSAGRTLRRRQRSQQID